MSVDDRKSVRAADDRKDGRKARAVALLVEGWRPSRVAAEVGVDERTLRRWRTEPEFALELETAKREALEGAKERLFGLVAHALDALEAILVDAGAPTAARMAGIRIVLERAALDTKEPEAPVDPVLVEKMLVFLREEARREEAQEVALPSTGR